MIDRGRLDEIRHRPSRPHHHRSRQSRARPRRRQPLVRGHPHRRPQPPAPQNVRRDRPPRRKDPPHRLRSTPPRRPSRRASASSLPGEVQALDRAAEGQEGRAQKEYSREPPSSKKPVPPKRKFASRPRKRSCSLSRTRLQQSKLRASAKFYPPTPRQLAAPRCGLLSAEDVMREHKSTSASHRSGSGRLFLIHQRHAKQTPRYRCWL